MKSLRVELRFKNAVLFHLLEEKYGSLRKKHYYGFMRQASEAIGINYQTLVDLVALRQNAYTTFQPGRPHPEFLVPRKPAKLVAEALGVPVDIAFPADLYSQKFETVVVDVEPSKMLPLSAALALPAPEPDTRNEELHSALKDALGTLKPKERRAIELLSGFAGSEPLTTRETAHKMKLSPARVGQIRDKAMRKLRHPSRSHTLREFL